MKYLIILTFFLLTSCSEADDNIQRTEANKELVSIGVMDKKELTPEEQGYPEYIFAEEKIEDMHKYLINEPVPIKGAVKYEALKRRVPVRNTQFNTTVMNFVNVDGYEYVNNIDGEFRYKVTSSSGEINFYKIQYVITGGADVAHFINDNNYFY